MENFFLPLQPDLPADIKAKLEDHYTRGALSSPAASIPEILGNDFNIDIAANYGPLPIAQPIGKASGQLSLNPNQVAVDGKAGLGFCVLKTVIAEDDTGDASMDAWKVRKPRMLPERIEGERVERSGWTISWAGRGWEGSLSSYLDFVQHALEIGSRAKMPVIPSVKYNLPSDADTPFLKSEYDFTTRELSRIWRGVLPDQPLVLEQDFSPTLAGDDMSRSKELIMKWLSESPRLIKDALDSPDDLVLGIKLMNAMFEDAYQLELMEVTQKSDAPADFLICFNRLFDPGRPFGDKTGIAYGGPDLSDRNLWVLRKAIMRGHFDRHLPISATGDITSGRIMIEYALRGATSGQLHTFFQLPNDCYTLHGVSRVRAALHELYFHPTDGIVAAMSQIRQAQGSASTTTIRFLDLPEIGRHEIAARFPNPS